LFISASITWFSGLDKNFGFPYQRNRVR